MKKLIVLLFLAFAFVSKGQNLVVEGTAPNLYITHLVAPKENFYSIGRLYNQAPKQIASFNNLVMEKGLAIGQKVKIPLNAQNFDAAGNGIPLTHVVSKSESLFKIGTDFNVTAQQIRQWNNLSSDNIAPGTPLVVGHLKMTSGAPSTAVAATTPEVKTPVAEPKKEVVNEKPAAEPKPKKDEPFVSVKDEPVTPSRDIEIIEEKPQANEKPVAVDKAPTKKEDAPKGYGGTKEAPVETKPANDIVKEEPVKEAPVKEVPVKTQEPKRVRSEEPKRTDRPVTGNVSSIEGAFAGVFGSAATEKSLNTKSGEAATFKSTSGWQDKKYYVLMNDVTPGTILKISSADNNKTIYAKVLGSMPEMKENNGLLLRISNAAASYLGIIDPKFAVQVSFYQ